MEAFITPQESVFNDRPEQPSVALFTVKGLNELTSNSSLDWLKIVNKLLLTEVGFNEVISVHDANITAKLALLIGAANKQ